MLGKSRRAAEEHTEVLGEYLMGSIGMPGRVIETAQVGDAANLAVVQPALCIAIRQKLAVKQMPDFMKDEEVHRLAR